MSANQGAQPRVHCSLPPGHIPFRSLLDWRPASCSSVTVRRLVIPTDPAVAVAARALLSFALVTTNTPALISSRMFVLQSTSLSSVAEVFYKTIQNHLRVFVNILLSWKLTLLASSFDHCCCILFPVQHTLQANLVFFILI